MWQATRRPRPGVHGTIPTAMSTDAIPCPGCGVANPAGKRFCGDCGAPLAGPTDAAATRAAVMPARVAPGPPRPAGRVIGVGDETERRLVTILFADLVGSTALGESLDPEQAAELISAAHQAMARAVETYGGYVLKYL